MPSFVIHVESEPSEPFMSWFPSLTAETHDRCTVLRGELPDQASLLGVLHALDMLGLRIQVAGLATSLYGVPTPPHPVSCQPSSGAGSPISSRTR